MIFWSMKKKSNLYERYTNMEIIYTILFQFKVFFVTLKVNLILKNKINETKN